MATRTELLDEYESRLNGFIIRCDAFKHPVTKKMMQRYPQSAGGESPKAKVMADLRSAIIEVEESPDGSSVLERHITFWWDNEKNVKGNVQFYVKNRGQPDEEAMWLKGQNPKPKPPERAPTVQQEMSTWLRGKVGQTIDGKTIKHIANITADQEAQTATTRVLIEESGALQWVELLLERNAQGAIQWKVIPQ